MWMLRLVSPIDANSQDLAEKEASEEAVKR
jgi:hypothetical protein